MPVTNVQVMLPDGCRVTAQTDASEHTVTITGLSQGVVVFVKGEYHAVQTLLNTLFTYHE